MILLILGLFLNLTPAKAIIGGVPVSQEDQIAQSTVLLYGATNAGSGFLCSGTILNSQFILTAAHCVVDVKAMYVLFTNDGSTSEKVGQLIREKTYARTVTNVKHNIDYPNTALGSSYPHNDIGLVKYAGGIPAGFRPVTILNPSVMAKFVKPQQSVVIAGFGQRGGDGKESGLLYKNEVKIQTSYAKTVIVGEPGSSACHGDSGGPAFVSVGGKLYQWGVLSRGEPGCTSTATYTPLTSNFFGQMGTPNL